jgi:hypothetical protein
MYTLILGRALTNSRLSPYVSQSSTMRHRANRATNRRGIESPQEGWGSWEETRKVQKGLESHKVATCGIQLGETS